MTECNLPEGTLALHGKDIIIAYDDAADARKAFDILEEAIATADQQPAWTSRLAHIEQRTPIERQCADLKATIEGLGAHLLLTDALNAVDLAMRILGKWHDEGMPGGIDADPA